jgi:hypothetical protein
MHAITTLLVATLAATLLVLVATLTLGVISCLMHAITALLAWLAARKVCRRRCLNETSMFAPPVLL